MDYNVVITSDAEKDLDSFIHYLLFEKKNEQAASSVLDDFEKTKQILSVVAGRLVNILAILDNIFHELQDYESFIK